MTTHRHPERDRVIGARIRIARAEAGLSQTLLAQRLGISYQQVQKYEAGRDRVAASALLDLGHALGKPAAWFLEDDTALAPEAAAPGRAAA